MRSFLDWLLEHDAKGRLRGASPDAVPDLLMGGEVFVVFQPLVHLDTQQVFAYEALVRSTSRAFSSPPQLLEAAIEADCCGLLGRLIREMAVEACPDHPLFLNVHPHEFSEGWLVQPDDPIFRHEHPVYLEVTESVPLSHFEQVRSVLAEIRHKGVLLAVDDLGAGYSNLKYIADLAPDVVKLDRGLVENVAKDSRLRMLVQAIVRLCDNLGARVVAEGIEERDEMLALIQTGAHYGQGFFFGRPSNPPPPLTR